MSPSSAEYMREYRKRNPDKFKTNKAATAARSRAMERLADLHADEFAALYNKERASVGLPEVGKS